MRILITGVAGFLGTNLAFRLLGEGQEVVGLDNLSTGLRSNAEFLSKNEKFTFIQHDMVDPLPKLGDFDLVYNLACPASPPKYQLDPIKTFRTSVWGVWNIIEYLKNSKTAMTPIVQASTSEVYGNPLVHPQIEGYFGNVNPIGIRSCYDEGKRAAETLLMDYHRMTKKSVKIIRIFNSYGPFMDKNDGRAVSNFIVQALNGQPISLYGNGKQTRSFCYVDDTVDGLIKMAMSRPEFTGPVNIGNPNEITLLELIDRLEKAMGKKLERKFLDLPKDDPTQRKPDIHLAKKELGWQPKVDLEIGLAKTIAYFKALD